MKEIPLSHGYVTLVDDEDYERLVALKWRVRFDKKSRYAISYRRDAVSGKPYTLYMHRVILNAAPKTIVDHRNQDGLDNQRSNLRIVTFSQNKLNLIGLPRTNTSGYRGVSYHQRTRKWKARLNDTQTPNGKSLQYLGLYLTAEEAAQAYDKAAREHFPEYIPLNFPEAGEQGARLCVLGRFRVLRESV